jgi:hypothetical protein
MPSQTLGDNVQRIHVANLAPTTSETSLRALFEPFGDVLAYEHPVDTQTEAPGAYVLLRMAAGSADRAVVALDGQRLDGRAIRVSHS